MIKSKRRLVVQSTVRLTEKHTWGFTATCLMSRPLPESNMHRNTQIHKVMCPSVGALLTNHTVHYITGN